VSDDELVSDLLRPVTRTSRAYWAVVTGLGLIVAVGAFAYLQQLRSGLQVTAMRNQVSWGIYIANFVFFIGISHVGALMSAILRLSGAEWRRPVTRMAEAVTVCSLFVGAAMPIIDLGRPDRLLNVLLYGRLPMRAEFSWGLITLFDRYAIENEFATLGGELIAEETAPDTTVAVFSSPGPILRLGGHSQDVDRVAPELGAFFGRMMVPIDFEPGVEEAISAASPLERYAAFVAWEHARYAAHAALRDDAPATASVLAAEAIRLAGEEPDAWEGGHRLARRMGLEVAAPGPSV